jgi:hypothetical protein
MTFLTRARSPGNPARSPRKLHPRHRPAHLVHPTVTRRYQCVAHCVRRPFLLTEGPVDRRHRIEHRLKDLF